MTKAERLLTLLTEVDDVLVEEAAQPFFPDVRKTPWGKWVGLAVCLLLAVGLVRIAPFFGGMGSAESEAPGEPMAPSVSSMPAESCPAEQENPNEATGEAPPTSGESVAGDGDPGEGSHEGSVTPGEIVASDLSPITGETINLIYQKDSGSFLLTCGTQEILLPVGEDTLPPQDSGMNVSSLVHLAVNGYIEDEFSPLEHASYENYVLISFTRGPGQSTCLVVGINDDGFFDVNGELYLSHSE